MEKEDLINSFNIANNSSCIFSIKKSKMVDPGFVYIPYIIKEHTKESLEKLDIYNSFHALCPNCGSNAYNTTLVGYPFTDLEIYKDMNKCTCLNCNDIHIMHDRISTDNLK